MSDPALAGVTGRFYDRETEAGAHPPAYDPAVQQRLWQLSLDLTGTAPGPWASTRRVPAGTRRSRLVSGPCGR